MLGISRYQIGGYWGCLLLLIYGAQAFQGNSSQDSILQSTETSDSLRISTLLNLAYDHSRVDLDKAFYYINQADSITLATGYLAMRPYVDYNKAMLHRNKGEFDQSLFFLKSFMDVMTSRKDSQEIMKGLNVQMTVQYELKDYEKTLETALKLKELSELRGYVKGQITALSFMALTMSDRDYTDEAINHYQEAIALCLEIKDSFRLANIYNNLAGAYLKKEDHLNAIKFYQLTKELDEKEGYEWGIFNSYHNIGNVYLNMKKWMEAEFNLNKAYDIQKKIGSIQELTMTENKLGYVLAKQGKYESGLPLLDKALRQSRQNKYLEEEESTLKFLSEVHEDQGNYRQALTFHQDYKGISDKVYKAQLRAKTDELQVQYETNEREAEINALNASNQIKDLRLKQAQRARWVMLGGILLLLSIALLVVRNNALRKKTNFELQEKNKVIAKSLNEKELLLKEIHHRVKNNLQIISSLLNLQSRTIDDETARGAMLEGQNRVKSMALIHQNLYQEGDLVGVDTKDYIEKLADNLWRSYQVESDQIQFDSQIEPINLDVDIMIPLGLIINELISNALKHAFKNRDAGKIKLDLHQLGDQIQLAVSDNGIGMPSGTEQIRSNSMGMKLINAFANKLKGKIDIIRNNGTKFLITIPTPGLTS